MSQKGDSTTEIPFRINRLGAETAPLTPANRFLYSAVDDEVQLDVCFYDLPSVREKLLSAERALAAAESTDESKSTDVPELDLFVAARYILNPVAALSLLEAAQGIVDHFQRSGRIQSDTAVRDEESDA